MTTVYDLTLEQLTDRLVAWGEPAFRAKQVWRSSGTAPPPTTRCPTPAPALRERLAAELPLGVEVLDERTADRGATRKALLKLGGQHVVEAVLMGYPDRVTVCVSSQAGCAMGCTFCATGQMGLQNNLTAGEIAAQAVWARREAAKLPDTTPQRLTNVVFMGMGEPFANQRHVFGALAATDRPGHLRPGRPAHHGLDRRDRARDPPPGGAVPAGGACRQLPRGERLAARRTGPARTSAIRWRTLEDAIAAWRAITHRRPSIEWALIDRVNDTIEQAELLAPIARRLGAHVNLIPLNPTPGYPVLGSPPARIRRFVQTLEKLGANVTVRDTRGRSIDAACGQLALAATS